LLYKIFLRIILLQDAVPSYALMFIRVNESNIITCTKNIFKLRFYQSKIQNQ
jgi:hypothetical protein